MSAPLWVCLVLLVLLAVSTHARPKWSSGLLATRDYGPPPPPVPPDLHVYRQEVQYVAAASKAVQDPSADAKNHLLSMKNKQVSLMNWHLPRVLLPVTIIKERLDLVRPNKKIGPLLPLCPTCAHPKRIISGVPHRRLPSQAHRKPPPNIPHKPFYIGVLGHAGHRRLCKIYHAPSNSFIHYNCNSHLPFAPVHPVKTIAMSLNAAVNTGPAQTTPNKKTTLHDHQVHSSSTPVVKQDTARPQQFLTLPDKLYNVLTEATSTWKTDHTSEISVLKNTMELENEMLGISDKLKVVPITDPIPPTMPRNIESSTWSTTAQHTIDIEKLYVSTPREESEKALATPPPPPPDVTEGSSTPPDVIIDPLQDYRINTNSYSNNKTINQQTAKTDTYSYKLIDPDTTWYDIPTTGHEPVGYKEQVRTDQQTVKGHSISTVDVTTEHSDTERGESNSDHDVSATVKYIGHIEQNQDEDTDNETKTGDHYFPSETYESTAPLIKSIDDEKFNKINEHEHTTAREWQTQGTLKKENELLHGVINSTSTERGSWKEETTFVHATSEQPEDRLTQEKTVFCEKPCIDLDTTNMPSEDLLENGDSINKPKYAQTDYEESLDDLNTKDMSNIISEMYLHKVAPEYTTFDSDLNNGELRYLPTTDNNSGVTEIVFNGVTELPEEKSLHKSTENNPDDAQTWNNKVDQTTAESRELSISDLDDKVTQLPTEDNRFKLIPTDWIFTVKHDTEITPVKNNEDIPFQIPFETTENKPFETSLDITTDYLDKSILTYQITHGISEGLSTPSSAVDRNDIFPSSSNTNFPESTNEVKTSTENEDYLKAGKMTAEKYEERFLHTTLEIDNEATTVNNINYQPVRHLIDPSLTDTPLNNNWKDEVHVPKTNIGEGGWPTQATVLELSQEGRENSLLNIPFTDLGYTKTPSPQLSTEVNDGKSTHLFRTDIESNFGTELISQDASLKNDLEEQSKPKPITIEHSATSVTDQNEVISEMREIFSPDQRKEELFDQVTTENNEEFTTQIHELNKNEEKAELRQVTTENNEELSTQINGIDENAISQELREDFSLGTTLTNNGQGEQDRVISENNENPSIGVTDAGLNVSPREAIGDLSSEIAAASTILTGQEREILSKLTTENGDVPTTQTPTTDMPAPQEGREDLSVELTQRVITLTSGWQEEVRTNEFTTVNNEELYTHVSRTDLNNILEETEEEFLYGLTSPATTLTHNWQKWENNNLRTENYEEISTQTNSIELNVIPQEAREDFSVELTSHNWQGEISELASTVKNIEGSKETAGNGANELPQEAREDITPEISTSSWQEEPNSDRITGLIDEELSNLMSSTDMDDVYYTTTPAWESSIAPTPFVNILDENIQSGTVHTEKDNLSVHAVTKNMLQGSLFAKTKAPVDPSLTDTPLTDYLEEESELYKITSGSEAPPISQLSYSKIDHVHQENQESTETSLLKYSEEVLEGRTSSGQDVKDDTEKWSTLEPNNGKNNVLEESGSHLLPESVFSVPYSTDNLEKQENTPATNTIIQEGSKDLRETYEQTIEQYLYSPAATPVEVWENTENDKQSKYKQFHLIGTDDNNLSEVREEIYEYKVLPETMSTSSWEAITKSITRNKQQNYDIPTDTATRSLPQLSTNENFHSILPAQYFPDNWRDTTVNTMSTEGDLVGVARTESPNEELYNLVEGDSITSVASENLSEITVPTRTRDERWPDPVEEPDGDYLNVNITPRELIEGRTEEFDNVRGTIEERVETTTPFLDGIDAREQSPQNADSETLTNVPAVAWEIIQTPVSTYDEPWPTLKPSSNVLQDVVLKFTTEIESRTDDSIFTPPVETTLVTPVDNLSDYVDREARSEVLRSDKAKLHFVNDNLVYLGATPQERRRKRSADYVKITHLSQKSSPHKSNESYLLLTEKQRVSPPKDQIDEYNQSIHSKGTTQKTLNSYLSTSDKTEDSKNTLRSYASLILELLPVIRKGYRNNAFSEEDKNIIQSIFGDMKTLKDEQVLSGVTESTVDMLGDDTTGQDDCTEDCDYDTYDSEDVESEELRRLKKSNITKRLTDILKEVPSSLKRNNRRASTRNTRSSGPHPISEAAAILLAENGDGVQLDNPDDEDDDEYEYYEDEDEDTSEYDGHHAYEDDEDKPSFGELILLAKKHRERKAMEKSS